MKRKYFWAGIVVALVAVAWIVADRNAGDRGVSATAKSTAAQKNPVPSSASSDYRMLQTKLQNAEKRAAEAEADLGRLLQAVSNSKGSGTTKAEKKIPEPPNIEPNSPEGMFRTGKEHFKKGEYDLALSFYSKSFSDSEGIAGFSGVRRSFLLAEFAKLAKEHPPARTALEQLRAAAAARLQASSGKTNDAITDYVALCEALGDSAQAIAYYDSLAPEDASRALVSGLLYNSLIDARRYRDVTTTKAFQTRIARLEQELTMDPQGKGDTMSSTAAINNAGKMIEALAAIGDDARARDLVAKIVIIDTSPTRKKLLQDHLIRAGRSDLAVAVFGPTQNAGSPAGQK
jgi:tetratricopeptide (TPR) repeat protein